MAITIIDAKLSLIKSVLGYPTEDGEFLLTDDQIKEFCVEPALRQYFAKFPKVDQVNYDISYSEQLEVDYPDDSTYGVVDARITHQESPGTDGGYSNFLYRVNESQQSYLAHKNFGRKGYNPSNLSQATRFAYQALKSQANIDKTIRIHVDHENRKVIAQTNRGTYLLITWAKYSEDFSEVKFNYIQDVVDLSQGYMLKHAARTMGIFQNTNLPVSINYDFLNSEGDALITRVTEKWSEISGVMLIRN